MKIVTARHENRDEISLFSAVPVTKTVTSLIYHTLCAAAAQAQKRGRA